MHFQHAVGRDQAEFSLEAAEEISLDETLHDK